ncbi:hypothetical protein, partial [Mesorhizobium sp. M2E.F.Ca.ET.154.01.1.1]|uniref:hypothetical protein n=1 Tax=Mesorhizobium sp. M2E.F.Ca.ET.154.01.1.1 TaxID=2500521 RepID=UPI001FEF6ED4
MAEHRTSTVERLDQAVFGRERWLAGDKIGHTLGKQYDIELNAPQPLGEDAPDRRLANLLELIGQTDLV